MALFKISKGTAANLVANRPYAAEGNAYFTTDDGKFYIDISGDGSSTLATVGTNRIPLNAYQADKLSNPLYIDNIFFDGSLQAHVGNTVHYIEGNTTGTAGTWTGSNANITSLYPGLTIAYKIGVAGASTTTLNINGLGAVTVYRNNSKITTHLPVNTVVLLVYDGTYWRWADYDSNTTNLLAHGYIDYKLKTTLYRYQLVFTVDEQYLVPANAVSNNTGTTKTLTTEAFDPFGEIYYYNSTTTISSTTAVQTSSAFYSHYTSLNLAYSFNTGSTLVAGKSVYLVCEPQGEGLVKLASNPISQSLPTAEDGLIYKYLGQARSTTNISLRQHKPCYQFKNGAVRPYTPGTADRVANNLTIKLNGGTTEGTNQFTYNGSVLKTINITPASIGALSASDAAAGAAKWITPRAFTIDDYDGSHTGASVSVDGSTDVSLKLPSTIKATLEGLASQASSTVGTLTIKLNSGTTENTNQFTYNGSNNKSIDITPSSIGALGVNATAAAATKLATPRAFVIKDSDETNTGTSVNFDGTANVTLKLPSTIKATLTGTATQVSNVLTIKLNGGTVEGTSQFTYNGSALKTVDITAAAIGALPSGGTATAASKWATARNFYIADADSTNTGVAVSVDGSSNVTLKLPSTIKASLTGNASSADKVNSFLTIKLNSGETEGTNLFTYNGSVLKTINITPASINAVAKTGDTMTGDLTLAVSGNGSTPALIFLRGTATDSYDDIKLYDDAGKLVIAHRSGNSTWNNLFTFDISANTTTQNLIPSTNGTLSLGASDHLWNTVYATTFSGNATSANKVNNPLTIKLNGGETEGTNQFTYDGSAIKNINITPASIGALSASDAAAGAAKWSTPRNFTISDSTSAHTGAATSVDGSANVNLKLPATITATLIGNASTATQVSQPLTIKLNGGTTEDTNQFTYNGSTLKTINVTPAAIGAVALTGSTMTGNLLANSTANLGSAANPWHRLTLGGATTATMTASSTNPGIVFQENTGTQPVYLIYTDYDNYRSPAGLKVVGGTSATPAWFEVEGKVYASEFVGPLNGNAATATKVNQPLTIKLNGGTTENTPQGANDTQFTFNGSAAKTINITPASIGALASGGTAAAATKLATARTFGIVDADSTNSGNTVSFDGTADVTLKLPSTIKATLSGTATQVSHYLTIKLNGGTTEGTNQFTFNGAATKDVNITASKVGALAGTYGSSTTTFLRNDGTWATPANTTYTFAEGSTNGAFTVTPSGGTAQTVNIHGLGNAAYTNLISTYSPNDNTQPITGAGVKSAIDSIPTPMRFKGSVGTGGTVSTLPAAADSTGFVYKVITTGSYSGIAAKVGDVFVSNGTEWVLIPSGDEPSGTVTSIAFTGNSAISIGGSPITSSGTISIAHVGNGGQTSVSNSGRTYIQSLTIDTYGHVTGISSATETVTDTTYTFNTTAQTNKIQYKKTGASSWTDVPINISVENNITGVGVANTIAKFSENNTLTNGPAFGSSTTTFLRNDGQWTVAYTHPAYTAATAAAVKIGRDATGHVTIGSAITAADVGAATTGHTHSISIAASSETNQLTLAHGTKYAIVAGGNSFVFTTPSDNNTDTMVTQTATSTNANYEVLFSATADNTTRTETARKNSNLTFNPNTGTLTTTKFIGSLPEAYLTWGGKNFSASYAPIDAAMIGELGADRFAFLKAAGLTIEYSTDGGSTWTDYGATNDQKVGLFGAGQSFVLGKHSTAGTNTINDQLRVTIDTGAAGIYTALNKIAIYMSTQGNTVQVKIEKALQSTPTSYTTHLDWTGISGWSGWNILNISSITTYGNTASSQYGRIRFIFKQTAVNTNYSSGIISKIRGFGGQGWTVPSNLARNGHLYSYDNSQNASFPAQVTATQFNGPLNGNATSATKATQDSDGNQINTTYLKLSGGTMTGTLNAKANQYSDSYSGALNMNNSNIYGVNSIYTADVSDNAQEGIHFYRTATTVDTIYATGGKLYFVPNRTLGSNGTAYTVYHTGNKPTYSDVGAAASGHTHDIALATNTGTSAITLEAGGKYQLTAGGKSIIFTMPTSAQVSGATQSATTGISISDHGTSSIGSASGWSAGTASSWTFEEKSIPNVTAAGSGSLTFAMDSTDTLQLNITHTHTAPTLGTAIKVQSKSGGSNSTKPSLTITSTTVVTGKTHTITDNGHTHNISITP